ncbi:MAG: putative sporulation protein YtxC [Clostridiaceae bacterium]|nr:putative sporulation protein YtxC [Clostridiaceae bacterium]
MEQFSIITNTKEMQNSLLEKVKTEMGDEAAIEIKEDSLVLKSNDDKSKEKLFNAISKSILEQYENKLISKLINQNYFYFNLPDKKNILKKAKNYADSETAFNALVNMKLKEYFSTSNSVMIDGFVNFRLSDYQNELEELIDKAVGDFIIEKEYKEFISLLKCFVDIQKPRCNVINIIPNNGSYNLYNEIWEDISDFCMKDFIKEAQTQHINSDDLLVSVLITVAPRKIYLHNCDRIKNTELVSTIRQVFLKRVTLCDGCDFCNKL